MYYPKLKALKRRRVLTARFGGYDHRPSPGAGAFYEMENLSGDRAPLLTVRPRRTAVTTLGGCPTERVLAAAGEKYPVVLDAGGSLWCGGHVLPRLLEGYTYFYVTGEFGADLDEIDREALLAVFPADGSYAGRYDRAADRWVFPALSASVPGTAITFDAQPDEGDALTVEVWTSLTRSDKRRLTVMGGWVCVFPDGVYANAVKLRQGQELIEGEDYGPIARENSCHAGSVRFEPCGPDGTVWSVTVGDTDPGSGFWIDTSEPEPVLRCYSQSQSLWIAVSPYVKCSVPGIAKGLLAGDGVELFARLGTVQPGAQTAEDLWLGTHVLTAAWHDPGAGTRPEGTQDYIVFPGLLTADIELELTDQDNCFLTLTRPLPEMDFVVECQNRLWGCRYDGQVNELYGSKLGDFRNWAVFEGLSTDSYRVSRGRDSAFTGAAVLGGCPLFFRETCLEKIYPARAGDHGVVTVDLEGIEAGSADSAAVIRDRLYYKSPRGVCSYGGALPTAVSAALGPVRYHGAVAGALDGKYYVSMYDAAEQPHLFVLRTDTGLWYREDGTAMDLTWTCGGRLYFTETRGGGLRCIGAASDSDGVSWYAETGDLLPQLGTARYDGRLRLTARLDSGAAMKVKLRFDGGAWIEKGSFTGTALRSLVLPILPRRCSRLRLRLEGTGGMELHELTWLTEQGSDEA